MLLDSGPNLIPAEKLRSQRNAMYPKQKERKLAAEIAEIESSDVPVLLHGLVRGYKRGAAAVIAANDCHARRARKGGPELLRIDHRNEIGEPLE